MSGKYEFYNEYTLYVDNADETEKCEDQESGKYVKKLKYTQEQVQTLLLWYDRFISTPEADRRREWAGKCHDGLSEKEI